MKELLYGMRSGVAILVVATFFSSCVCWNERDYLDIYSPMGEIYHVSPHQRVITCESDNWSISFLTWEGTQDWLSKQQIMEYAIQEAIPKKAFINYPYKYKELYPSWEVYQELPSGMLDTLGVVRMGKGYMNFEFTPRKGGL